MKRIEIIRGGQKFPMTTAGGDKYDSVLNIYDNDVILDKFEWVNTDPRKGLIGNSGILAEGTYKFVVRMFKGNYLAPLILSKLTMTEESDELPSLIPNPRHGGKKKIKGVFIHRGGQTTDGSAGCQTIYPFDWPRFSSYFQKPGEGGNFILSRDPDWLVPPEYQGT